MIHLTILFLLCAQIHTLDAFPCSTGSLSKKQNIGISFTALGSAVENTKNNYGLGRRKALQTAVTTAAIFGPTLLINDSPASAGTFTPGGTLVDRDVGATVGNPEASLSRKFDNSNVLFGQDHYFKFGVAAPWIEPGSTEFPKTMPFTVSQQRYDTLKKYGDRVIAGVKTIDALGDVIKTGAGEYRSRVADPSAPEYALRPMGLMANGFLASENTGTTNELLLARWYINEIYLAVGDIQGASSEQAALKSYVAAKKAVNSYLGMINRVITPKVGDKFELLTV